MPRDWAAWSFNVAYRDEEVNRANFGVQNPAGYPALQVKAAADVTLFCRQEQKSHRSG